MAGFFTWETAELELRLSEPVLSGYREVVVSISQAGAGQLDIREPQLAVADASTIVVSLTQEQTGAFHEGKAFVQVNVLFDDSRRNATAKGEISVRDNLYRRVMA